jgi:hypothetical protein
VKQLEAVVKMMKEKVQEGNISILQNNQPVACESQEVESTQVINDPDQIQVVKEVANETVKDERPQTP